jgi:hypothetical protein
MELIRKDKEKFRSARKIAPTGKPALIDTCKISLTVHETIAWNGDKIVILWTLLSFLDCTRNKSLKSMLTMGSWQIEKFSFSSFSFHIKLHIFSRPK